MTARYRPAAEEGKFPPANFGAVSVVTLLVLPLTGAQKNLHINFGTFAHVFVNDFGLSSPNATRCHSVCSIRSPFGFFLSVHDSVVAIRKLAMAVPSGMLRNSGSAPRFPMMITLLTVPFNIS